LQGFALAILAPAVAIGSIHAATASASISVSATVQASCVASTVMVDCNNSVPYNISLSAAVVQDGNLATRPMLGSAFELLGSALNSNPRGIANRSLISSTNRLAGLGSNFNSLLAIHDQIPSAQCTMPGAYPDTMIVVVTY